MGKVILLCHEHLPKYWAWYNVYVQYSMLFYTFCKLITCPFHAYVLSSPFITIGQLEILSYNIVFFKHMAQYSNQLFTDPNWPITNPLYNCIISNQFPFFITPTNSIFWHFFLFFIIWHANYLGCVCNRSDLLIQYITVFSIYLNIFSIHWVWSGSFPSSNDVNQFNLFNYFMFWYYFSG